MTDSNTATVNKYEKLQREKYPKNPKISMWNLHDSVQFAV